MKSILLKIVCVVLLVIFVMIVYPSIKGEMLSGDEIVNEYSLNKNGEAVEL